TALTSAGALPTNEDHCATIKTSDAALLVLADGAGGHAGGEVASKIVVDECMRFFKAQEEIIPGPAVVVQALRAAQTALREEISRTRKLADMRSTGLVVLAERDGFWVGHVGDSRAYLIRAGQARRLTVDDTLVQALVSAGSIAPDAGQKHSQSHVLLQCLGQKGELEFHVTERVETQPGDVLVACSDGLTEVVSDEEIARVASTGTGEQIAERLMTLAADNKVRDNVTVSAMNWRERSALPSAVARSRQPARPGRRRPRGDRRLFLAVATLGVLAVVLLAIYARLR
ncbi:MAG: protein phosphatase 2C domain-containing protein, partial [Deltaproteobacteria bacterium]